MAMGNIHSGIMAGKLNGVMPTQTPMDGIGVDGGRDIFGKLAELQAADGAGMFDDFQTAEYIAFGIGQGLALFGAQGARDAAHVLAHQRLQLQHDAGAGRQGRVLPGLVGFLGAGHGGIYFRVGGEWHLRQHFLSGRIDDIVPFGGLRLDELAVDQQFDAGRSRGRGSGMSLSRGIGIHDGTSKVKILESAR
jgi:hypothetical protein